MKDNELTNIYRKYIKQVGAVQSGNMLNNTDIFITTNNEVEIEVDSVDYFNIIDKKYNITNKFLSDKRVKDILKEYTIKYIEDNFLENN